jgi:hypothetical protein
MELAAAVVDLIGELGALKVKINQEQLVVMEELL